MALRDVDRSCVLQAMEEFDRLGREAFLARYGFGRAREYFVVEGGGRYDSKALVGAAHRFTPDAQALLSSEFSGGANVVQPLLLSLGFRVVRDPDEAVRPAASGEWDLAVGETIRRVDLHERYGGSRQDGVSPSRSTPNVFLFTAASSGEQHGYFDRWREDGYFYYTGRGQRGDQTFTSGNLAILNHREEGRALRVFEGARGTVEYAGEFELVDNLPWIYENAPETGGGPQRRVIIFRLAPLPGNAVRNVQTAQVGIEFRMRREDVRPAAAQPATSDPDVVGRGLTAHRRLENDLASMARARGLTPLDPSVSDPSFDVAWNDNGVLVICEVKSLTAGNLVDQLRKGLGQVLDYAHTIRRRGREVRPILYVEMSPGGYHWTTLCDEVGVVLAWPGHTRGLWSHELAGE